MISALFMEFFVLYFTKADIYHFYMGYLEPFSRHLYIPIELKYC